jgi:predicted nucleic acid-binding protein
MNILLDTSIIIDYTRQSDNPNSHLSKLTKKYSSFFISDITLAELYSGKYIWESPDKMNKLKSIIAPLSHLPTSEKMALVTKTWAGTLVS